jgi:hypothetical protein
MDKEGVEPTSREYQQMERALAGASAAMYETEAAMNSLTASEGKAAGGAGTLEKSLSNISTKVSLDAVIGGIGKITGGLESAAKKAVNLGQTIFDELMDSAKWADDAETMAQMFGVPLEKYLQMEALVKSGMDTSVDAILGGMSRVKKSVGKESAETMNILRDLGLVTTETLDTGFGKVEQEKRLFGDADDLFWKAGKAIMAMGDAYDQEAAAQAIFGKGWRELVPLFTEFSDEESFNKALKEMNTNTEEQVKDLAALNDAMGKLEHNFDVLKNDVLAELAPALTKGAEALSGLLDSIMEYLDTPEGKQMLADLGTAIEGLFDDLTKIDPAQVVEGFTKVFGTIVEGLQWMVDNKDTLTGILTTIVAGWGLAKLTGGALDVLNLINGIRGLGGANGVNNAINQIANGGGGGGGGGTPTTVPPTTSGSGGGGILKTVGNGLKFAAQAAEGSFYALSPVAAIGLAAYGAYRDYNNIVQKGEERVEKLNQESQNFNGQTDPMLMAAWSLMGEMHGTDVQASEQNAAWIAKVGKMFEDSHSSTAKTDPTIMYLESLIDQGRLNEDLYDQLDYAVRDLWKNGSGADTKLLDLQALIQEFEDELARIAAEDAAQIPVTPTVEDPEAANQAISKEIGAVPVPIVPVMGVFARKGEEEPGSFANGIWSVPWDGYPAILHKGERVMPAREIGSRSYNSNLYVESMYMNNGTDAAGLAAAMAAAQQRTMSGYGS